MILNASTNCHSYSNPKTSKEEKIQSLLPDAFWYTGVIADVFTSLDVNDPVVDNTDDNIDDSVDDIIVDDAAVDDVDNIVDDIVNDIDIFSVGIKFAVVVEVDAIVDFVLFASLPKNPITKLNCN